MSERRVILSMAVGDYWREVAAISLPLLERYASRVGADVRRATALPFEFPPWSPTTACCLYRLDLMRQAFLDYDRVLWLDADVLVRPDSPDLFALVPPTHWAGYDELPAAWAIGWEAHVHSVHRHMVEVCREDGLEIPDSGGRYFNGGVQLASRAHRHLYAPAVNPSDHAWGEQSRVNVRLFLARVPVYHLPAAFNAMPWASTRAWWPNAWMIHYAGVLPGERLAMMRQDLERWKEMGLWSDT